ncbi:MAG: hypothetical protein OEN48_16970 [Betaproteobacteria bacterium]|nr:hypothetical protein [Betaproteobacteria bacterium]
MLRESSGSKQGTDRIFARSGLTAFVAGLARKTVRHNVTINNSF